MVSELPLVIVGDVKVECEETSKRRRGALLVRMETFSM